MSAPPPAPTSEFGAPHDAEFDGDLAEAPTSGWRLSGKARQAAIQAPGPTWHEWLYAEAFKWWLGIALLIVDGWILAGWLEAGNPIAAGLSLALALYLEYLLYQYLWHPYSHEHRGPFRPSWHTPFLVGRWRPEWAEVQAGQVPPGAPGTPNPKDFL